LKKKNNKAYDKTHDIINAAATGVLAARELMNNMKGYHGT